MIKNWTWEMYGMVIRSWVTKAYIDQPCRFNTSATNIQRKAEVPTDYQLSESDLRFFIKNGFIGPFDCFSETEVTTLIAEALQKRQQPSPTFGIVTDRDLYLDSPRMLEFMRRPAIVDRCAQLLGPNLLVWRSQLFFKPPGGKEIQWHQASTYFLEDYLAPALVPPDRNELFQLTVWIALSDVTKQNGCLEFVPGTHDEIRPIKFGGTRGFYKVSFDLQFDFDPRKVLTIEMKAGQFILFSERMIHGSGPNRTDKMRFAMNYRVIPPNVRVYPRQRQHKAMHMGQSYSLANWGTALLRGKDEFGYNPRAPVGEK
jgi:non-heme Fe2+,alpha-ketoglutarate-dependent halogenase